MTTNAQFPVLLNYAINESENHCDIKADITGFRAKNVRVSCQEDSLIIDMQTDHESPKSYYMGEVEYENFRRQIPLGFPVNGNQVLTHYLNGKLSISVTKLKENVIPDELGSCAA